MQIECTQRIIKTLEKMNKNMRTAMVLRDIENVIDGGRIDGPDATNCAVAFEVLKDYLKDNNYDEDICRKNIAGIEAVRDIDEINRYISLITEAKPCISNIRKMSIPRGSLTMVTAPVMDKDFFLKYSIGLYMNDFDTFSVTDGDVSTGPVNIYEYNLLNNTAKEAFGSVVLTEISSTLLLYLLAVNDKVSDIKVLEERVERYDFACHIADIISSETGKEIRVINSGLADFLSEEACRVSCIINDSWKNDTDIFSEYKTFMETVAPYKNIKVLNVFEAGILDTVRTNILQYITAKLGTPSYLDYYKQIAPQMYDILEKDTDIITIPQQLYYYTSYNYAKKVINNLILN